MPTSDALTWSIEALGILHCLVLMEHAEFLSFLTRYYSGYNTTQALKVLPRIMPSPEQAKIRFMTIFFGANDARLPNTLGYAQTVPLETYKQQLIEIATNPAIKTHNPHMILITPPPIDERLCEATDAAKGINQVRRTAENTARYAEAVREVGEQLNVPVLDIWKAFMQRAGWSEGQPLPGSKDVERNAVLTELMHDGLHFNPAGYRVLFDELMKLIERTWPDQMPDKLPFLLPPWDDADAWLE
ncbi:hypothetical protein LTR50_006971 [Elasticomyces elasticus]|nr:hypothetical protein LTR50_006971 [Elasticomyces elasticus]